MSVMTASIRLRINSTVILKTDSYIIIFISNVNVK